MSFVACVSPEPTASSSLLAAGSASNKSILIPLVVFNGVIAESCHKCGFGRASQAGGEHVDVMSGEHLLIYGMMHNYEIVKLKVEKVLEKVRKLHMPRRLQSRNETSLPLLILTPPLINLGHPVFQLVHPSLQRRKPVGNVVILNSDMSAIAWPTRSMC
jgi:hypothetical protein